MSPPLSDSNTTARSPECGVSRATGMMMERTSPSKEAGESLVLLVDFRGS